MENRSDRPGIRSLVERTIKRNIKGVEYMLSPAPPVGLTPKDVVYRSGTAHLYHYHNVTDELYRVPILIVMATSNRGYVLDLAPGMSLVEFLVAQSYDVFMLDWDAPRPEEKRLGLADYTAKFIPNCIERIREITGEEDVSVIGYCMGGVLSTIYAATHSPGPLKNLICLTTPVDFSEMGKFSEMSDPRHFDVDALVDSVGNVPSDIVASSFFAVEPGKRVRGDFMTWQKILDDDFMYLQRKLNRWTADMLPLAGEYFRQFVKDLLWENKLLEGSLVVGGRNADLGNIHAPFLHVVAEYDSLIPREASAPLVKRVSSEDREELVLRGGHVSFAAGRSAPARFWPKLDAWLAERSN